MKKNNILTEKILINILKTYHKTYKINISKKMRQFLDNCEFNFDLINIKIQKHSSFMMQDSNYQNLIFLKMYSQIHSLLIYVFHVECNDNMSNMFQIYFGTKKYNICQKLFNINTNLNDNNEQNMNNAMLYLFFLTEKILLNIVKNNIFGLYYIEKEYQTKQICDEAMKYSWTSYFYMK